MKKVFYSFLFFGLLFFGFSIKAQTPPPVTIFEENFDTPPSTWKMENIALPTPTPSNPGSTAFFYWETQATRNNSPGAASDTVGSRTTTHLQTPNLGVNDPTGTRYPSVGFSFEQICYIDRDEDARVEYSLDSGVTWRRMPASSHTGSNYNINGELKFTKLSNPVIWGLGDMNDKLWTAAEARNAWAVEDFNLTDILNNNPTVDSIKLRLSLVDDVSSTVGRIGTQRWIVENFRVVGSNCETISPVIDLQEPPVNYESSPRYEDRIYSEGPYSFNAQITDGSTIKESYIAFELKREVAGIWTSLLIDTIPMVRGSGPNYAAEIPKVVSNGETILVGDSVYWQVVAIDNSGCDNKKTDPLTGYSKFLVKPNLPEPCRRTPVLFDFPYYQTFENTTDFPANNSGVLGQGWSNPTGDFHDWWVKSGPSSPNGTFRINNSFPAGGQYLYVESSKPNTGNFKDSVAFLQTPCFDLSEIDNGLVKFYLNMNTSGIEDSIRVDIFDTKLVTPLNPEGGYIEGVIPVIRGNKGDNWLPFEFSTFPFKDQIIVMRFAGYPGKDNGLSDMAIDSFKLTSAPLIDVRTNNINIGPFNPVGTNHTILVNVQNLSVTPVDTMDVYYGIDCSAPCTPIPPVRFGWKITPPLAPGESRDVLLPTSYVVPRGDYTVRAWVDYIGDDRPTNDTTFANSKGLVYSTVKYMENFDGENTWTTFVSDDPLANQWELGEPSYDYTYSAYTEPNSWDVLLNRPYTGTGKTISLISPFLDFSSADDAILSFINNRDMDETKDGVYIEYSLDRGLTWDSLTGTQDPDRLKWYNSNLSAGGSNGDPVFSGRTFCWGNTWSGYLESELILPTVFNFQPEVLIRFNFFAEADDSGNDGMSIDNILIYDPTPLDMQPQHFLSPSSSCELSPTQTFTTIFKNRGLNTVTSFDIEYRVTHLPTGREEVKTETINRVVLSRDSIHVTSVPTFNMFDFGDYEVKVIADLNMDGCVENDTLVKFLEKIEGCSLQFYIETSKRPNVQLPCDSSYWSFNYTSGGREYRVSQAYNSAQYPINLPAGVRNDTIKDLFVCIKSNSQVTFNLNDIDTLIERFSLIAFDGKNDTILFDQVQGGPDAPVLNFDWLCPPERSATPVKLLINNDRVELPIAQDYDFTVKVLNNGLDSLDSYDLSLQVDNLPIVSRTVTYPDPNQLFYNRCRFEGMGSQFLTPGKHIIKVWTSSPNGQLDLLPEDDTLTRCFIVMDTVRVVDSVYSPAYCDDFEGSGLLWISTDPYNLDQRVGSFERGVPAKSSITSASSGTNAWITSVDDDYPVLDSTSFISPFIYIQKDSCYRISFMHNYHITDSINDGGTIQMLREDYSNYSENSWKQIGNSFGDTSLNSGDTIRIGEGQKGWFNRRHILAIPNNNKNSGWSGISNGWVKAENIIRPDQDYFTAFRWRFESDGSVEGDGWAVDDFCFESISSTVCTPVGIDELLYNESELYLGQNIPNPATDITRIPYYVPQSGIVEFKVVNMLGQTMYQESISRPKGDGLLDLNLSDLSKGIYFYTMNFNGISITNKMIIAK